MDEIQTQLEELFRQRTMASGDLNAIDVQIADLQGKLSEITPN